MTKYLREQVRDVEWGAFNRDSMQDILGRLMVAIVQHKDTLALQQDWVRVLDIFDYKFKDALNLNGMIEDIVKVWKEAKGRDWSVWHQILCPLSYVRVRHGRLEMERVIKMCSHIEFFLSEAKHTSSNNNNNENQDQAKGNAIVSATMLGLYLDQSMYFPRK